jgi:hypothetical protein
MVERGLGTSLPPAELARRDSALFVKMKCLFFITPEARKQRQKSRVFIPKKPPTGCWTGRGPGWTCASGELKSRTKAQRA